MECDDAWILGAPGRNSIACRQAKHGWYTKINNDFCAVPSFPTEEWFNYRKLTALEAERIKVQEYRVLSEDLAHLG